MNQLNLNGHLVRDPELMYTRNGKAITKISVAYNHKKDEVSFFECTAWDKCAENIAKYCQKGTHVLIEAEARQERWKDKAGTPHNKIVFTIHRVTFLTGLKDKDGGAYDYQTNGTRENQANYPTSE